MAMSKPYPTGQICILMRCELCDTDCDVNWFCKNCIKNLCDNCKQMHSKIPSLCTHDIGSIGEGRKFNRSVNMHCSEHGELLQYRCKPCFKDICVKCLDMHLKHELINLTEEGENMRKEFRTFLESKRNQMSKMDQQKTEIQKHIQKYKGTTDTTIAEIQSKFDQIVKMKESMLKKIEDRKKSDEKELRNQHQVLEETVSSLQSAIERSEDEVRSYGSLSLAQFIRKKMSEINDVQIPTEVKLTQPLVISQGSVVDAERIFGTLELAGTKRQPLSTLNVISSFSCSSKEEKKYIFDIACTTDEKAWIAGFSMPLRLVDHAGIVYCTVELIPFAVYLAVSPSGDVLASSGGADPVKTKIKKISQSGSVSDFKEVKSCQYICALTFDSKRDLLCLLWNTQGQYQLAKFSNKGKGIWKTTIGKCLFYISTLCISPEGNVNVVMDKEICVVSTDGKIIERKLFDDSLGNIGPMIYDTNGYPIVGTKSGRIHVFDQEMKLLKTFTLQDELTVYSLAADSNDLLWIGRSDGKVFIAKYLE